MKIKLTQFIQSMKNEGYSKGNIRLAVILKFKIDMVDLQQIWKDHDLLD